MSAKGQPSLSLLQSDLLQSLAAGAELGYGRVPGQQGYGWSLVSDGRISHPHALAVQGLRRRGLIDLADREPLKYAITPQGRALLAAGHTISPPKTGRQPRSTGAGLSQ